MAAQVQLELDFIEKAGTTHRVVTVCKAVVGGWTGRDKAALRHHIEELEKIGVKAPETTPMFYRVGVSRLVQSEDVEVIGEGSSGEVEYVMLKFDGRIWIGPRSDHTDRAVEHMGITARQAALRQADRARRLSRSTRSRSTGIGWFCAAISRKAASESSIREEREASPRSFSPRELLARYEEGAGDLEEGALMFGGTCGAIGGVHFFLAFQPRTDRPRAESQNRALLRRSSRPDPGMIRA